MPCLPQAVGGGEWRVVATADGKHGSHFAQNVALANSQCDPAIYRLAS